MNVGYILSQEHISKLKAYVEKRAAPEGKNMCDHLFALLHEELQRSGPLRSTVQRAIRFIDATNFTWYLGDVGKLFRHSFTTSRNELYHNGQLTETHSISIEDYKLLGTGPLDEMKEIITNAKKSKDPLALLDSHEKRFRKIVSFHAKLLTERTLEAIEREIRRDSFKRIKLKDYSGFLIRSLPRPLQQLVELTAAVENKQFYSNFQKNLNKMNYK